MLSLIRALLAFLWLSVCATLGTIYSLIRFRNINNLQPVAQIFSKFGVRILGIHFIRRNYDKLLRPGPYVIIANHQHNIDVAVHGGMVPPRTITVGKREIIWIPFFNLIFYSAGNLLIDRKNLDQAKRTLHRAKKLMIEKDAHIWLFPEGTRRYGLGLGPFKKGPFHLAVETGVPIQPIVASNYKGAVDLNRWKAGTVIMEALEPIETKGKTVEETLQQAHELMKTAIDRLDREIQRGEYGAHAKNQSP